MTVHRVLVYRLGSLGDTVVALPCFHLVARAFPHAERRMLTHIPEGGKAAPMAAVLGDSGLVRGYIRYPLRLRRPEGLLRLRSEIRAFAPDVLVYLAEPRGGPAVLRDFAFFALCGVPRIVGAPLSRRLRVHRRLSGGLWEHEARRLARCLATLGDARLDDPASWDPCFAAAEEAEAAQLLRGWPGSESFVAFSVGTKKEGHDWGDASWRSVLSSVGARFPGMGLVLLGAAEEAARSSALAGAWPGPRLNLCGRTAPRLSGLVIKRASLFIGHDSGPMHLAAAVGTPCVAVFGGRNRPGTWYPYGTGHRVFHPALEAGSSDIEAIRPEPVTAACIEQLVASRPRAAFRSEDEA